MEYPLIVPIVFEFPLEDSEDRFHPERGTGSPMAAKVHGSPSPSAFGRSTVKKVKRISIYQPSGHPISTTPFSKILKCRSTETDFSANYPLLRGFIRSMQATSH